MFAAHGMKFVIATQKGCVGSQAEVHELPAQRSPALYMWHRKQIFYLSVVNDYVDYTKLNHLQRACIEHEAQLLFTET